MNSDLIDLPIDDQSQPKTNLLMTSSTSIAESQLRNWLNSEKERFDAKYDLFLSILDKYAKSIERGGDITGFASPSRASPNFDDLTLSGPNLIRDLCSSPPIANAANILTTPPSLERFFPDNVTPIAPGKVAPMMTSGSNNNNNNKAAAVSAVTSGLRNLKSTKHAASTATSSPCISRTKSALASSSSSSPAIAKLRNQQQQQLKQHKQQMKKHQQTFKISASEEDEKLSQEEQNPDKTLVLAAPSSTSFSKKPLQKKVEAELQQQNRPHHNAVAQRVTQTPLATATTRVTTTVRRPLAPITDALTQSRPSNAKPLTSSSASSSVQKASAMTSSSASSSSSSLTANADKENTKAPPPHIIKIQAGGGDRTARMTKLGGAARSSSTGNNTNQSRSRKSFLPVFYK